MLRQQIHQMRGRGVPIIPQGVGIALRQDHDISGLQSPIPFLTLDI
jgi:hypothetical protein